MPSDHEILRKHFYSGLHLVETESRVETLAQSTKKVNLDELRKSQWDSEFELQWRTVSDNLGFEWNEDVIQKMKNRLLMGALRYGGMSEVNKPKYDYFGEILNRYNRFEKTGNAENLVDAANFCLLSYHFKLYDLVDSGVAFFSLSTPEMHDWFKQTKDKIFLFLMAANLMDKYNKKDHVNFHFESIDDGQHTKILNR